MATLFVAIRQRMSLNTAVPRRLLASMIWRRSSLTTPSFMIFNGGIIRPSP